MHGCYNFALSAMVASAAMSSVDAGDLSAGGVVQIEMNSDMPVLDLLLVNDGISDDDDEDLAGRKLGKSSKSSSKNKTHRAGDGDNSSSKKKKKKKKMNRNRNNSGKKTKKKNQTTKKSQTDPEPIIVNRADNGAVEEDDIVEKAGGGAIPIVTVGDSYNFVPAPTTSTIPILNSRESYNFVPVPTTSPLVAVESWDFIPKATSTPTVTPSKMPTASPTASPSKIPTMNAVSKADVTTGTGTDALNSKYQCFYEQGIKICFAYREDQKCEMSIENYECSCCLYTDPNHPVINSFDCTNIGPEWGALGVCASPDMRADNLDFPSDDGV